MAHLERLRELAMTRGLTSDKGRTLLFCEAVKLTQLHVTGHGRLWFIEGLVK